MDPFESQFYIRRDQGPRRVVWLPIGWRKDHLAAFRVLDRSPMVEVTCRFGREERPWHEAVTTGEEAGSPDEKCLGKNTAR